MAIRMGLPPVKDGTAPILLFPRANSLRVGAGYASSMLLPLNQCNRTALHAGIYVASISTPHSAGGQAVRGHLGHGSSGSSNNAVGDIKRGRKHQAQSETFGDDSAICRSTGKLISASRGLRLPSRRLCVLWAQPLQSADTFDR